MLAIMGQAVKFVLWRVGGRVDALRAWEENLKDWLEEGSVEVEGDMN